MVPSKVDKCEDSQDNKRMQREGKPGRITACTACYCLPLPATACHWIRDMRETERHMWTQRFVWETPVF